MNPPVFLAGAARSSTAYPWWSTRWTARVLPASTRRPSGGTPPGTGCPRRPGRHSPEARPRRVPTACSASRSCSSTRRPSRGAPPSTGSCPTAPGENKLRSHDDTYLQDTDQQYTFRTSNVPISINVLLLSTTHMNHNEVQVLTKMIGYWFVSHVLVLSPHVSQFCSQHSLDAQ